ncbi:nuclear transport factor 2 family protein [Flavitalea flava]
MKQILLYVTMIYFPVVTYAQEFNSKKEKEVYNTIVLIGKAWTENNLDTLEKYIAKDYLHTDVRGQLLNRISWLIYVKERKQNSVVNPDLEFDSVKITIHKDFAFVTGINVFSGAAFADGKNKANEKKRLRFTQVLNKQNGIWQRILFQATYISNE